MAKAKKWDPQAHLDGVLVEEMIGEKTREKSSSVRGRTCALDLW